MVLYFIFIIQLYPYGLKKGHSRFIVKYKVLHSFRSLQAFPLVNCKNIEYDIRIVTYE